MTVLSAFYHYAGMPNTGSAATRRKLGARPLP